MADNKPETILQDAKRRMRASVENITAELAKIRTGKASAALLDAVRVEYYGAQVPIKQVANIGVPEPRLITIQPWDRTVIGAIEKAILKADLGLNPINDGHLIRLPIPELTEERRKELVKVCKKIAEEGRIAVRNVRRDANDKLKLAEKNHEISEDDSHRYQEKVQELTDEIIKEIDQLLEKKEAEIMEE
ncbi:MAG: ribosome recycling factor [Calditrichaeota bacterium]|nr:ribosome recycling factor [Calditrichota bacterium]